MLSYKGLMRAILATYSDKHWLAVFRNVGNDDVRNNCHFFCFLYECSIREEEHTQTRGNNSSAQREGAEEKANLSSTPASIYNELPVFVIIARTLRCLIILNCTVSSQRMKWSTFVLLVIAR